MKYQFRSWVLAAFPVVFAPNASAVSLGTVDIVSEVGGQNLTFPVALDLTINTTPSGVEMKVIADMNMRSLQNNIDAIAKSFPMPSDNCPGYGQHALPTVESVSLAGSGNAALLNAKVNVVVWDCQQGVPLTGTTVRSETRCVNVPLVGRVCTDVPIKVQGRPGPDIKNILVKEGFVGDVALTLTTQDKQSIELVPSNVNVVPRGDLGRFLNQIAGLFNNNLSSVAQKEIGKVVNAGQLRQALPKEVQAYNPIINGVQFNTAADGALVVHVDFGAALTGEQLSEFLKKSLPKESAKP